MKFFKLPIYALAAALITAPTLANAWYWDDDDDEEPFDEAFLYFELNDTDGDLGIHGKVDGDEWKYLEIEDPRDRKMLNVIVRGRLKRQGMTELFFESAEPCFPDTEGCEDGLEPEAFFRRFPEGEYDIEGYTLDGEERESEVYLSHIIPAAPVVMLNGVASASKDVCQCEEEDLEPGEECPEIPTVGEEAVLSWTAVNSSHATLGEPGAVNVRFYEVVVEIDETDFKSTSIVPPHVLSWEVPEDFLELSDDIKYEVLVRTNVIDEDGGLVMVEIDGEESPLPGNVSAMESCFEVD